VACTPGVHRRTTEVPCGNRAGLSGAVDRSRRGERAGVCGAAPTYRMHEASASGRWRWPADRWPAAPASTRSSCCRHRHRYRGRAPRGRTRTPAHAPARQPHGPLLPCRARPAAHHGADSHAGRTHPRRPSRRRRRLQGCSGNAASCWPRSDLVRSGVNCRRMITTNEAREYRRRVRWRAGREGTAPTRSGIPNPPTRVGRTARWLLRDHRATKRQTGMQ
jgi:hypothetical protein